ncbi:hypothetical protein Tco_0782796 [Tanacetum coccineum]
MKRGFSRGHHNLYCLLCACLLLTLLRTRTCYSSSSYPFPPPLPIPSQTPNTYPTSTSHLTISLRQPPPYFHHKHQHLSHIYISTSTHSLATHHHSYHKNLNTYTTYTSSPHTHSNPQHHHLLQHIPSPTPPPIPTPTSPPPPPPETEPPTDEHIYEEQSPVHHHFSPSQAQAPSHMPTDDLLQTVPKLISRIDSLELDLKQTKLTMGNAIVKLVKKVKKLEGFLKRRNLVLTDSEDEEPEVQGRKSQADPQDSSKQGLVTPPTTKAHASGEEQEEEISPNTLEAAKTLSKVASLKSRSIDKGRRYKRRKESTGKKVVSSLDFQEDNTGAEKINTAGEVNAASIEVNTASKVNTGSIELNTVIEQDSTAGENKGQREGKAPMLSEETPKKTKEQILQEEASLAEAIRLDSLQREEEAEQIHLDALLAQRIVEEEELTEQQKKRKAQVQFEAQHYTNEDWDLIRAKLEANAELSKSISSSSGNALRLLMNENKGSKEGKGRENRKEGDRGGKERGGKKGKEEGKSFL